MAPLSKLLLLLIGVTFQASTVRAAAQDADTLFQVEFESDENGGCSSVGRQALQTLLNEAETLARIGVQLVDDYDSADEAKRLLNVFIPGNSASSRNTLKSHYNSVLKFLAQGSGSTGDSRPFLFCSDTWLLKRTLKDEALDKNGESWPAGDLSGRPTMIEEVGEYMQKRAESAGNTAYWSSKHKAYLFDYAYGRGNGYCSVRTHQAVTSDLLRPASITLCPRSFGNTRLGGINMSPLKSSTIPSHPKDIPSDAQRLSSLLPTSNTLFHELFHLVLGPANSKPLGGQEQYEIIQMPKLSLENGLRNPETFAVMAVAYHYTRTVSPVDGNRVEFYGFFTTRG